MANKTTFSSPVKVVVSFGYHYIVNNVLSVIYLFPIFGAKVLSKPISDLCDLSIISEKFPEICKVAKLKPLYKKGSLTEPCNYRPISLLPLVSKVIEKVIYDHTSPFLKPFVHLSIWFSENVFCGFLPFLCE